ncbi:hypothetical protein [Delftia acidovorans]
MEMPEKLIFSMPDCSTNLAYHEAGHWIVARHLDFKVGEISLTVNMYKTERDKKYFEGYGSSHVDPEPVISSLAQVEKYLLERMAVLIAGVSAQMIVEKKRTLDEVWQICGSDDQGKLNELSFILRGIRFKNDISSDTELSHRNQLISEADELVKKILTDKMQILEKIAKWMASQVKNLGKKYAFTKEDLELRYSEGLNNELVMCAAKTA